jgi:uncharacterized integral membrane protein (TIGR00697 family)
VIALPPAPGFDANAAYTRVLGQVPRVLVGGWIAIFAGESMNNFVLAKMKVLTQGRMLWARTNASTIVGQFVNTVLFYVIALYAVLPHRLLVESILSAWALKVAVEAICTPLTYVVVRRLKEVENVDHYDHDTNFNPLIVGPP